MNKYVLPVHEELRRMRRARGATSPATFAKIYLSGHCGLPFSRMHDEVFVALAELIEKRAGRLAVAAPRDHAKSTIVSLVFVLWCVLYEKEKFVLLVSATRDQAILLLRTIKDELQKNSLLLEDFPQICRPEHAPHKPKPWRKERISLSNGTMIAAYGAGQGIRGAKNNSDRPGLMICDDIEDPERVTSEEQRQKLHVWFTGTLLHASHPNTNVIVVGTVLHHDSLLANLVNPNDRRGWTGLLYKAVERFSDRPDLWEAWAAIFRDREDFEGSVGLEAAKAFFEVNRDAMLEATRVLWPDREDYYTLMVMREREGRASFQAEKQNEPIDPEVCVFREEEFHYWDDEYDDVEALRNADGGNGNFFGACDPSLGHRIGRGDFTAIVILYQPQGSQTKHVIVADLARRTPDQAIARILEYARMYPISVFAVEANQFQELMVTDLRRRAEEINLPLYVHPITNRGNKQSRIANLEPAVTQGRIKLCRRHQLLLDQLRQFPLAAHDDGPDALEMAVQASSQLIELTGSNAIYISTWRT